MNIIFSGEFSRLSSLVGNHLKLHPPVTKTQRRVTASMAWYLSKIHVIIVRNNLFSPQKHLVNSFPKITSVPQALPMVLAGQPRSTVLQDFLTQWHRFALPHQATAHYYGARASIWENVKILDIFLEVRFKLSEDDDIDHLPALVHLLPSLVSSSKDKKSPKPRPRPETGSQQGGVARPGFCFHRCLAPMVGPGVLSLQSTAHILWKT